MQSSNLPIRTWLLCMHLMSATKKPISAKEMQRQLAHKRYEPIWRMMHKIRESMGARDDQYQLSGEMELDSAFFGQVILDKEEKEKVAEEGLKRGKGSQKQAKILVMIGTDEVVPEAQKKHKKTKKCNYLKMKVVPNLTSEKTTETVQGAVTSDSHVESDDDRGFDKVGEVVEKQTKHNLSVTENDVNKLLPWVHTAISNAKRKLAGTYHMIGDNYVQNYLNEFCYKFNRRYLINNLFDRLLVACLFLQTDKMT